MGSSSLRTVVPSDEQPNAEITPTNTAMRAEPKLMRVS
jgi:hypothetical protein